MHKNIKKIFQLIFFGLIFIGIILVIYHFTKESFETNSKIFADDLSANEDYQQCLNESNQISYLTNGKYLNCSQALSQLSSDGIDINSDIGFGQLSQLCPISSLASPADDCLRARLQKQNKTLESTKESVGSSSKNLDLIKMYNRIELDAHNKHMDKLFSDKEILDSVKYIKENRLKTSNDEFESVLDNVINPDSISSSLSNTITPSSNIFDDSDMKLKKLNNISILGY
jgi:hypothetical protein